MFRFLCTLLGVSGVLTIPPLKMNNDLATRHQWIERALDGIERFSNSSLTTDQKNGISVQFGVLMDQLEVAVNGLDRIAAWGEGLEVTGKFDEPGSASIAREALEQLKSSPTL